MKTLKALTFWSVMLAFIISESQPSLNGPEAAVFRNARVSGGGGGGGAGGTQLASDNFTRANSGTLGANWTLDPNFFNVGITANNAKGTSGGENGDYYSALGQFAADQYSEVTIGTSANDGGPTVRSNGNGTFYALLLQPGTGGGIAGVYKCVGTTFTLLGATFATPSSVGDTYRLSITGNVLTVYRDGSSVTTRTDSSIAGTGYPGIHLETANMTFSSWAGGTP